VFCPKAFDGIRDTLPDTLKSRSIPIPMHRHPQDVTLERFLQRKVNEELAPLRERLSSWAEVAVPHLANAEPFLPPELGDRHAECWEPLFAIADLASPEFASRARATAVELHRKPVEDEKTDVLFLRHLRDAFDKRQVDRLSTVQVVEELLAREDDDAPWAGWWGNREAFDWLNKEQRTGKMRSIGKHIANLLKPYGIKAKPMELDGKTQVGFQRAWFEQVWRSYLR
jgi:hypothetical protein